MTDMVMMMLGAFKFKISTAAYQRLRRSTDYRWPVQERLGREPARQFVGQGNDKIDLEGVIYPEFKGGLNQVSQMRDMAGKGQPLRLMASSSGKGVSWGNWCIEQIEETQETFFWDGVPRKIEFHLSLAKYGD